MVLPGAAGVSGAADTGEPSAFRTSALHAGLGLACMMRQQWVCLTSATHGITEVIGGVRGSGVGGIWNRLLLCTATCAVDNSSMTVWSCFFCLFRQLQALHAVHCFFCTVKTTGRVEGWSGAAQGPGAWCVLCVVIVFACARVCVCVAAAGWRHTTS